MKNKDVHGHDIPIDYYTEQYRCFAVRVPDKPEYIAAFFDSWFKLSSWLFWEKDEFGTAAKVSRLFKKYPPRRIACDVVDELDEDGNMTINVNVTTNCNCGGCGGNNCIPHNYIPDINGLPYDLPTIDGLPGIDEDTGSNYPDGFTDRAEYDSYKCQLAGELVDDWIDSLTALELLGAAGTGLGSFLVLNFFGAVGVTVEGTTLLSGLFGGLLAIGLSATAAVLIIVGALITAIGGGFVAWQYFGNLANELASRKDAIRCLLYNATTAEQAMAILRAEVGDAVATVIEGNVEQDGLFQDLLETLIDVLIPEELPALLLKHGANLIKGETVYDCAGCEPATGLLIDYDTISPSFANRLTTSSVIDDNGNMVMQTYAGPSGNVGGFSYNQQTILTEIGITSAILEGIEFYVRITDAVNDDWFSVVLGEGVDAVTSTFYGTALNSGWTKLSMACSIPITLSTANAIDFGIHSVGVRQVFLIDNIRVFYTEPPI